jgi:hypothetical protein
MHKEILLPYPASFPERFGGEMNTGLTVTATCGIIGAVIGIITTVFVRR